MSCDNCDADRIAYTLRTHVETEPNEPIDLQFCSTECLRVWT